MWIIGLLVFIGIVWLMIAGSNKLSTAYAERMVAAQDPEGYRLMKEYEESQKPENKARATALLEQQRREAKTLLTATLKSVNAPIVLKTGETAYWVEQCRYYEERSLRDLGMDRGMLEVDAGSLVLTDKRIVFVGQKRTIDLPYSKIVSIQQLDGSMQVSVSNGKSRRLGTGNPRAEVVAMRLLRGSVGEGNGARSKAQLEGNLVSVNLSQSFNGPRDLIVETLESIATMLQTEVDKRAARYDEEIPAKPVDASTYLTTISAQFQALAEMFAQAERDFVIAGSPKGSPKMLQDAYGEVLERLLSVQHVLLKMDAPPMFAKTEEAYDDYVDSFYCQIADWPVQVRKAAGEVTADSYDLQLSASYDIAPLEHAIAAESPT